MDLLKDIQEELGLKTGVETPVRTFVSTGNVALDWAISGRFQGGGLPVGRIVEFFGDPSTGKSLIISHILAETQRLGGIAILDDTEQALDPTFAKMAGVDLEKLILLESETVEEHFSKINEVVEAIRKRNGNILITVALDSLALLSTKHEKETGFDKVDLTKAKMVRQGYRLFGSKFGKERVLCLVSNHVIANIGVLYGPKKTTPGGSGTPFSASVRIELDPRGVLLGEATDEKRRKPIGVKVLAKVVKNRIAPPFREVLYHVYFATGFDKWSGLFDILVDEKIIKEKAQGWYWLGEKAVRRSDIESQLPDLFESLIIPKLQAAQEA